MKAELNVGTENPYYHFNGNVYDIIRQTEKVITLNIHNNGHEVDFRPHEVHLVAPEIELGGTYYHMNYKSKFKVVELDVENDMVKIIYENQEINNLFVDGRFPYSYINENPNVCVK